MMRILISIFLVIGCAFIAARLTLANTYRKAALEVCELVDTYYYRHAEPEVIAFLKECRSKSLSQSFLFTKKSNIDRINTRLASLNVSHLNLYRPEENRALWENRAVDTGLRARIVESDMIVIRVVPGSAAEAAGIQVGDVLDSLDGQIISSVIDAEKSAGRYGLVRGQRRFFVRLEPTEISEDLSPTLKDIGKGNGLLRIPSFLPQYFAADKWRGIAREILRFKHVIIDLRDNPGGSFPAMLRALSPFRCRDRSIGALLGAGEEGDLVMRDVLDTRSQLAQLSDSKRLLLKTFDTYGCFNGPATVLIDDGTSSTAEIFAESFYTRKGSRVWGQPSAGQVVMAQWFDVVSFADDTALSIPIAGYVSDDGVSIEQAGLVPEKQLYYDLNAARLGIDSWITESSRIRVSQ